jgi:hypothetical protein
MKKKKPTEDADPIVAEVRRAREQIARRFNYDLKAIFAYFQQRTEEAHRAGHRVARPRLGPAKKAG